MKQFIYLLGLCLAANFLSAYTPLENIRVVDGDTIRAEAKGKEIKIRLVEIDAPEMNQPFGAQSKNFLNRLLYKKDITLISQGEDRYFLHNALCIYKKQTLIDYPIDEKLIGKEDRYWAIDMINKNHKIYYDSTLVCEHNYTNNGATWKSI